MIYLDNSATTPLDPNVAEAMQPYLAAKFGNASSIYSLGREARMALEDARTIVAAAIGADPAEIVFTSGGTEANNQAIKGTIFEAVKKGKRFDELSVLTSGAEHHAVLEPVAFLESLGVKADLIGVDTEGAVEPQSIKKINSGNPTLACFMLVNNEVGTINPVKEIVRLAHSVGALAYVDAVHYGPHGLIDVAALDCDFLVCSTYKFFGPHMGVLFGKRKHLQRLRPYKVRPLTDAVPNRWEWGTLNHECIAGITACVEYIADLGRGLTDGPANTRVPHPSRLSKGGNDAADTSGVSERRAAIAAAYQAIHEHERGLLQRMVTGLAKIPRPKIYGITDPARFHERCATLAVRIENHTPLELATKLGDRSIFTWDGNYYALNLTEQLDVEKSGGFVRIGLVHYNTPEEVDRLLQELSEIVGT